jgi:hypothetical protein
VQDCLGNDPLSREVSTGVHGHPIAEGRRDRHYPSNRRPGQARKYNSWMQTSRSQLQLRFVVASYGVVIAVSALLICERYLQYVRNPQDVAASSGMYAGGDLLLELFIGFLFLVPTTALVFVIRKSESWYTTYAKALLGLSATAPISAGLLVTPVLNQWYWGDACIFRLFAIPMVIPILILSWWLTRFARARRLISYALLIEGLTFVLIIASLFLFKFRHG